MIFTSHAFIAIGHAYCFEFSDANKHLNQMNLLKNQIANGTVQYNQTKDMINKIETIYNQAKSRGCNDDAYKMRIMIKRELGL